MCTYLDEHIMGEHTLKTQILDYLQGTLEEFFKLKTMLEQCIDVNKMKNNEYIINPSFSPELENLQKEIDKVKRKMESLRQKIEEDLGLRNLDL